MNEAKTVSTENLDARVEGMTSLVSYPNRCPLWGDAKYRGNCDGRLFLGLLLRYRAKRVADPMMGSGTTRDVVEWLQQQHGKRIEYWGSDLKEGFNLHAHDLPGRYDFVWVHPPYWNIIQYSENPADLSSCDDYASFCNRLRTCLGRCYAALEPGGRLAVLVGDVRRRGRYFPMVRELFGWEGELGELRSVLIKAQHNCQSDAKTYARMADVRIAHEYCVVFQRPSV